MRPVSLSSARTTALGAARLRGRPPSRGVPLRAESSRISLSLSRRRERRPASPLRPLQRRTVCRGSCVHPLVREGRAQGLRPGETPTFSSRPLLVRYPLSGSAAQRSSPPLIRRSPWPEALRMVDVGSTRGVAVEKPRCSRTAFKTSDSPAASPRRPTRRRWRARVAHEVAQGRTSPG